MRKWSGYNISRVDLSKIIAWNDVVAVEQRMFYYLAFFALFISCSVAISNVFLTLAVLGMLHRLYLQPHDWPRMLPSRGILVSVACLWAAILLSVVFSPHPIMSVRVFADYYLYRLLPLPMILLLVRSKREILILTVCAIASVLINGSVGLEQTVKHFQAPVWRNSGFIFVMHQASILSVTVLALFAGLLRVPGRRCRWAIGVALLLALAALVVNGTRGAWLGTVVGTVIIAMLGVKCKLKAVASLGVGVLLLAGIMLVYPQSNFVQRLHSITQSDEHSNAERRLVWGSAIRMFEDHPVLGVGMAQFGDMYPQYISPVAKEPGLRHAHNNFLHVLAEAGVVGFLAFVGFVGYILYFSIRGWLATKTIAYLVILADLLGVMLHGLTEYTWGATLTVKFFWFVMGLSLAWIRLARDTEQQER